jgi:hypothetical protein
MIDGYHKILMVAYQMLRIDGYHIKDEDQAMENTVRKVAELLGVSEASVYLIANRNKRGKLKIGPDGRTYRVFSDPDIEFIRSRVGRRGRPVSSDVPPKTQKVARKPQKPDEKSLADEEKG